MKELINYLRDELELGDVDIRTFSPLVLAYIGDAFYELIIRTKIISNGNAPVHKLHVQSSQLVKAKTQAQIMQSIEQLLTEEEQNVFKRGRNAKSSTIPKNASIVDYRNATGFESLIGYLYLKEDYKRIIELIKQGLKALNDEVSV